MKKLVLLFLFSFTVFSGANAQTKPDTTSKKALQNRPEVLGQPGRVQPKKKVVNPTSSQALKGKAATQILNLKKGVLLVRLRTSDIAINNLKKSGNEKMAATVKRQQDAANQLLVHAFENQFNFCPVYYFYSSETEQVKTGKTKGYFLNSKLDPDPNIAISDTNYFIAELTDLEQFRVNPDSPEESVNAEVTFKALVLRDYKFHQMAKPFPYFIKASSNFPPRKRSEVEMVNLLNARLTAYYKQVTQGKYKNK